MSKQPMTGFTLIELMITIVIMMVLLVQGVPLTMQWVGTSNLQSGKTLFSQGMANAKSRALRNSAGAQQNEPAAYLLLSGGTTICAQEASYSTSAPANGAARTASNTFTCSGSVWTGSLPNATTGTLNSAAAPCVALNNAGVPVTASLGAIQCGTAATYTVTSMGVANAGTLN